jgi:hypothetical protein
MKKVLVPTIIIIILTSVIICPYYLHNILLNNFTSQLINYPLPPKTILIDNASECGNFGGTGDHIDYLACTIIKSDLPLDVLSDYYFEGKFKRAYWDRSHLVKAEVKKVSEHEVFENIYINEEVLFKNLRSIEYDSGYYLIYIYDAGHFAWWDIRGC